MPMFFVRLNTDGIARTDVARRLSPFLQTAATLCDQQQLRCAVPVPVGSATRLELDEKDNDTGIFPFDERQPLYPGISHEIPGIRRFERHLNGGKMFHSRHTICQNPGPISTP